MTATLVQAGQLPGVKFCAYKSTKTLEEATRFGETLQLELLQKRRGSAVTPKKTLKLFFLERNILNLLVRRLKNRKQSRL